MSWLLWIVLLWTLWASLVPRMVKNLLAMRETWVQSLGQEDPLEKGMATHSSIFAWRIPWTKKPGRLWSMRSQWVGHNLATKQQPSPLANTHCLSALHIQTHLISPFSEVDNYDKTPLAQGFPGGPSSQTTTTTTTTRLPMQETWDLGSIPRSGRSPGEGHDNSLQYFCLENSMDRGAWQSTVHKVTKSHTRLKWLTAQKSCTCLSTNISKHFL